MGSVSFLCAFASFATTVALISGRFKVDCARKSVVASRATFTKSPVHVSSHAANRNSNCSCTGRSMTARGGVLHFASSKPPHTYSSAKIIQRRRRAEFAALFKFSNLRLYGG